VGSGVAQAREPVLVEPLVAEAAVEALRQASWPPQGGVVVALGSFLRLVSRLEGALARLGPQPDHIDARLLALHPHPRCRSACLRLGLSPRAARSEGLRNRSGPSPVRPSRPQDEARARPLPGDRPRTGGVPPDRAQAPVGPAQSAAAKAPGSTPSGRGRGLPPLTARHGAGPRGPGAASARAGGAPRRLPASGWCRGDCRLRPRSSARRRRGWLHERAECAAGGTGVCGRDEPYLPTG
jgi:hypothetical protein